MEKKAFNTTRLDGRQAIVTRYLGPSNVRGSRISAKCAAKRIILNWQDGLNTEDNHKRAALTLMQRLGWHGEIFSGGLANCDWVHVQVPV